MSFLTANPDLSGTKYSNDQIPRKRDYLISWINHVNPGWLDSPKGALGEFWRREDKNAVSYLLRLADIIWTLDQQNAITAKSDSIFREKIKQLTREKQFDPLDDIVAELEFAAAFVKRISPLSFEPLVPQDTLGENRPASPDYGIRLPDGDILFEVTVFNGGVIREWEETSFYLDKKFDKELKNLNNKWVEVTFPIHASRGIVDDQKLKMVSKQIKAEAKNEVDLLMGELNFNVRWRTIYPIPKEAYETRSYRLAVTDDIEDILLKAIRRKFDDKRKQLPADIRMPYFLVIKFGSVLIRYSDFVRLLDTKIFPDTNYRRISGIVYMGELNGETYLEIWKNNNAKNPVSDNLIDVFRGVAEFHLHK
ncbi:hypothetical protein [Paenibacillus sp. KR2-11]|uniref:hypothetical protein n=1 Tax=Paenibacillus sp. KR2-11 TaxID=3385500 RepID=UPI0038FCF510